MTGNILHIQALGFPWPTRDPFLFTAHHLDHYPSGNDMLGLDRKNLRGRMLGNDFRLKDGFRMYHGHPVPGFPRHPHRGFETITINLEGFVDHSDSMGATGRFGEGDVQWMTAGRGIQHAEMFPLLNPASDNPLEIVQIWMNLPARSKMVEPHFRMLWKHMIPQLSHADTRGKQTRVDAIAGELEGITAPEPTPDSWAADPGNGVQILLIHMEAGAQWTLPGDNRENVNRSLFFFRGESLQLEEEKLAVGHRVDLEPAADILLTNGREDAALCLMQGKPLGEPVAQHGPFVMNTREEIIQAYEDFQRTGFGKWPWESNAPHHGSGRGRFARHADGRTEEPENTP
jgi:redox-sensitive bicupin YhaK (pirin superfamily)